MEKQNEEKAYSGGRQLLLRLLLMAYDIFAVNISYFLALLIRLYVGFRFIELQTGYAAAFRTFAPWYTVCCLLIFSGFKLYNSRWEFAGIRDMNRIVTANALTFLVQVVGTLVFVMRMPVTYYILGAAIQLFLIVASRFAYRLFLLERNRIERQRNAKTNAMVIGIGKIGQFARRQLEQDTTLRVVCVVGGKADGGNQYLNGLPIIPGLDKLESVLEKNKIGYVVIANETLPEEEKKRVKTLCEARGVEVQDFIEYLQNNNDVETPVTLKTNSNGARVIPFSPPDITDLEIEEVRRALKSGWITTGPRTKELEKKLAGYCHTSRVVCLSSATAAEELNFRICGIGEGDEVIVPAYTYTASASAAIHCGAKVVFVDSQ